MSAAKKHPAPFEKGGPGGPGRPRGRGPNPLGTKGIVQQIRELTDDGRELIEFFYKGFKNPEFHIKDRTRCAEWLGDRLYGKAPETQLVGSLSDVERAAATAHLADAELETLARSLKAELAPARVLTLPSNPSESLDKPTD